MSSRFTNFKCNACDYSAMSCNLWGKDIYSIGEEKVQVRARLGWCNGCNDVCRVEDLPKAARADELLKEVTTIESRATTLINDFERSRSWLDRLLNLNREPPKETHILNDKLKGIKAELSEEMLRLRLMSKRSSPPRCLTCGSTNAHSMSDFSLNVIDRIMKGEYGHEYVRIGLPHLGCSGEIHAALSEERVRMVPFVRKYNVEGYILDKNSRSR